MVVSISDWLPSDGLILEEDALKAVKDLSNSLVVAGPGAGKTELLAQKASFLIETNSCLKPKKILAISFKKDAAYNLKERVDLRIKQHSSRFSSLTYDSFAKGILDRFINSLPEEYKPVYDYAIDDYQLNATVKAFANHGVYLNSKDKKKHYINQLVNVELPINNNELLGKVWMTLLKGTNNNRATLTFPMITKLATLILKNNPLILISLRETYSHVFLDEFQDTTNLQYELVKTCFFNTPTSITAVGDNRQRIMVWAGAKVDVFDAYKREFKAVEYSLKMNHRSAPRLLAIQKIVNNYLQKDEYTPIPSPKWDKNEGTSEVWYFNNAIDESQVIASKIDELITHQNIKPNEICIVVKQSVDKYSKYIIHELKTQGINARNETVFQDLLKEEMVTLIICTFKASLDKYNSDAWIYVWDCKLMFTGLYGSKTEVVIEKLRRDLKEFLKLVKRILHSLTTEEELLILISSVLNFFNLNVLREYYPKYSQGTFINRLSEDLTAHLFKYYQETKDWAMTINRFEGKDSIPIMTIHKSKGLEYEAVFFIGFDDRAFWSFNEQENEDTCTFFVGLSRAKRFLYFTYSETRDRQYHSNQKISILYRMLKESGVVEELNF